MWKCIKRQWWLSVNMFVITSIWTNCNIKSICQPVAAINYISCECYGSNHSIYSMTCLLKCSLYKLNYKWVIPRYITSIIFITTAYSIFQHHGTPPCMDAALSYLFLSGLCLSFWQFSTYYCFKEYDDPFHILHIYATPTGHCANQLQPVLLTAIGMYGNGFIWAIHRKTRKQKVRHRVALAIQAKKDAPGFTIPLIQLRRGVRGTYHRMIGDLHVRSYSAGHVIHTTRNLCCSGCSHQGEAYANIGTAIAFRSLSRITNSMVHKIRIDHKYGILSHTST